MNTVRISIIALLAVLTFWQSPCMAQCNEFTENEVLPLLSDGNENFIISGKYNAVKLNEGDDMLIFRSLTKGITYRFIAKGEESMPDNTFFVVESWQGDTLFNSSQNGYPKYFDYENKKNNQRVKIYVKVPASGNKPGASGCVSVVTGIKSE